MNKIITVLSILAVAAIAYAADHQPQRPQGRGRGGPGMGMARGGLVMAMDTNKDGNVSKEEMLTWFDKADVNKDGVLNETELRATRPQGLGGPRGRELTHERK